MAEKNVGNESLIIVSFSALGITSTMVALSFTGIILSSANILFPLLILLLIFLLGTLIRASYPKLPSAYEPHMGYEDDEAAAVATVREDPTESENQERQYFAYVELKHLLVERVTTRRDIGMDEWNRVAGDDCALYAFLGDEDLLRLVRLREGALKIPKGQRIEGVVLGQGFKKRFDLLLGKVEDWQ